MQRWAGLLLMLLLLLALHSACGFLCFSRGVGSDYMGVTYCPSGSCFSVGASVVGSKESHKGCSEDVKGDGCIAASLPGLASAHTCFCNGFLCNSATSKCLQPVTVLGVCLAALMMWVRV
ncbi:uncharacterized protein LOC123514295 [Portunus trituberculatus]|uniref:uncharacterized protein LOC123514295 n=1 Tax=Portunus trituberculatus TaxID=210409 RepID=UPI001E1CB0DB|nr:uncharacterized protein LOC123514295 [Portunus trituberculatus]